MLEAEREGGREAALRMCGRVYIKNYMTSYD